MKKFFYSLFLSILIFITVDHSFSGLTLPTDILYRWGTLLALSFGVMLHKPILKFLTVKINFLTYFVTVFLLIAGVIYGLEIFIPNLYIESSSFEGFDMQVLTINAFNVSAFGTLLGFSMVSAIISGVLEFLKRSSED